MATTNFTSVGEYISSKPEAVQAVLRLVCGTIRKALPNAAEVISYKMPTYKLKNEIVLHVAAWKDHYSLYGATSDVLAKFKSELKPYEVIKGTIRFPLSEAVPAALISRIAKFRAKEVLRRTQVKATEPRPQHARSTARKA